VLPRAAPPGAGSPPRAWHVARCAACRAGTTQPWPTPAELAAAYPEAYRPAGGRFGGPGDRLLARTRGLLARRIALIAPPGPVLDVGAGDGSLLRALRARGRDVLGLERGDAAAHADVPMRDAAVADLPGDWAAIVFWHALEHLPAPAAELAAAAERLAPGGVLVIAVPNPDSLQAHVFGADWLALDLPRHLVHLPRDVLLGRLTELGLAVERVSGWRGGQVGFGMLHGLVRCLPGRPDLYDALRRPGARLQEQRRSERRRALAAGVLLAPLAGVAAAAEIAMHRGGTTYVEARRVHR
jgi:SAM-dependent methyltransferase